MPTQTKKQSRILKPKIYNYTLKRNNRQNTLTNINTKYSKEYIERMSGPLYFKSIIVSNNKLKEYNEKYGDDLTDEQKMDIFMSN
jgi:hypothetical protein